MIQSNEVKVKILKGYEGIAKIPEYQSQGAAGFDFHSAEDITLLEGQTTTITTGLAMQIPDGYEIQVRSRSGLAAKHGVFVLNAPGTLDSDYRGEIKIILANSGKNFTIKKGDRIAQGVLCVVPKADFVVVESLNETARGEEGFGSTGK